MKNKKLWGGRFSESTDELLESFSESITFDNRLFDADITGSITHANALEGVGVLTTKEKDIIVNALEVLRQDIVSGKVDFFVGLEDIHMNIESILTDRIGDLGKKLHTGRSRNDQVAHDIRLFLMAEIDSVVLSINSIKDTIVAKADEFIDVIIPGFTHLQIAQPVLFSHHLLAYYEMLDRDVARFLDCKKRTDTLVLGSAALAGSTFGQDRLAMANQAGFLSVSRNSMDAVADRDFVIEFLAAASICMMHISRLSEDIILWMSDQFNYVTLGDAYTTGSSIMPQKRNPDIAELSRGKTGRVYGNLVSLLTTMKGLPLTYNRDLQEDKEPLFDTVDTVKSVLKVYDGMLKTLGVNEEKCARDAGRGFSGATDFADYLVRQGVPFREAHRIVGEVVKHCEDKGVLMEDVSNKVLAKILPEYVSVDFDMSDIVMPVSCVNARNLIGGTAPEQVKRVIDEIKKNKV